MTDEPPSTRIAEFESIRDRVDDWAHDASKHFAPQRFAQCSCIVGLLVGAVAGYLVAGLFGLVSLGILFGVACGYLGWQCEQLFPAVVVLAIALVFPRSSRTTLAVIAAISIVGGLIQVCVNNANAADFAISMIVYAVLMLLGSEIILATKSRYRRRAPSESQSRQH